MKFVSCERPRSFSQGWRFQWHWITGAPREDWKIGVLTHKIGIELELLPTRTEEYRCQVEEKIRRKNGVVHAEFSREQPDIIIVEYDPFITTPYQIYNKIMAMNDRVSRKIFL